MECVADRGGGLYSAYFGYNNPNPFVVEVPVGSQNEITSGPINQGQPTSFSPGRATMVFSLDFYGAVGWRLDGTHVIASNGDAPCP